MRFLGTKLSNVIAGEIFVGVLPHYTRCSNLVLATAIVICSSINMHGRIVFSWFYYNMTLNEYRYGLMISNYKADIRLTIYFMIAFHRGSLH